MAWSGSVVHFLLFGGGKKEGGGGSYMAYQTYVHIHDVFYRCYTDDFILSLVLLFFLHPKNTLSSLHTLTTLSYNAHNRPTNIQDICSMCCLHICYFRIAYDILASSI